MDGLTRIAGQAAETILDVAVAATARTKDDGSPVTAADEAAEAVIVDGLRRLVPDVPIISEEAAAREKPRAIESGSYFLIDPLDGTREFIAGGVDYTVNIALVTDSAPILGIICQPGLGRFWRGIVGRGADWFSFDHGSEKPGPIHTRPMPAGDPVVMVSRSHLDPRTKAYVDGLRGAKLVPYGSSAKFCRLAEGAADLYPRLAPTHDWDIAAGHAILVAAGGRVMAPSGGQIAYGSKDLLIPAFVAWGDPTYAGPIKD
jgi:3'(2'), 5'-bisphosphate nucleotidase